MPDLLAWFRNKHGDVDPQYLACWIVTALLLISVLAGTITKIGG